MHFWLGLDRGWGENQYHSTTVEWSANLDHFLPDNMIQQSVAVHISQAQTFLLLYWHIIMQKLPMFKSV